MEAACRTAWARSGASEGAAAFADSSAPVDLSLPLDRFAGQCVAIRVAAYAGPERNPTCDWGLLRNPRVTVLGRDQSCKLVAPAWTRHLVAPVYRKLDHGGPQSVTIPAGGAVMVTSLDPTDVSANAKLSDLPHLNVSRTPGSATGEGVEESMIDPAAYGSGGVERRALFSHPPDRGMRMLHYFVRPPAGARVSVRTAVGIRDGSKSEGVLFAVWLNGNRMWSRHVVPADGWVPVEVDLGRLPGEPAMITLVTDSEGPQYYDWALWAEPEIIIE